MRLQEGLPFMGAATSRGAGLSGILLVGLIWSFSALGATNSIAGNENCLDKLQGMDTQVPELLIVLVDLPGDDSELGLTDPLGPSQPADTTVPHLYLTHRVESMLDDVFADDDDSNSLILESEEGSETQPESDTSFPPIAEESEEHSTLPGLEESGMSREGARALPRFQRQMYRTDI